MAREPVSLLGRSAHAVSNGFDTGLLSKHPAIARVLRNFGFSIGVRSAVRASQAVLGVRKFPTRRAVIQITAKGKNGQWIRVLKRHDPKLSREFGKLATPFGTPRGFLAGEVNLVVSLSRDASAKFPCPNRSYSAAKSFRYMYRIRSQSTRRPPAAISRACEAVSDTSQATRDRVPEESLLSNRAGSPAVGPGTNFCIPLQGWEGHCRCPCSFVSTPGTATSTRDPNRTRDERPGGCG